MSESRSESDDFASRPPDPFVTARISTPSDAPQLTLELTGLLGDSDRDGKRRLYFNTRLDYYAEFDSADVMAFQSVGPDQPPFIGLDATRVSLKRDARVDYVHAQVARDPFELDVRLGMAFPKVPQFAAETWEAECPGPSFGGGCATDIGCGTNNDCPTGWGTVCKPATCLCTQVGTRCRTLCDTCRTCEQQTCQTCPGQTCQQTCQTCPGQTCQQTCQTCPGQTCQTCPGQTCQTCRTCPGQTCRTCNCTEFGPCPTELQTHCFTCRPGCERF
jgi:hypothetical protein